VLCCSELQCGGLVSREFVSDVKASRSGMLVLCACARVHVWVWVCACVGVVLCIV
jgi:hypothetical protein